VLINRQLYTEQQWVPLFSAEMEPCFLAHPACSLLTAPDTACSL